MSLLQSTNASYTEIGEALDIQKQKVEKVARRVKIDGVSRMQRRREERKKQLRERVLKEILNNPQMTYTEIGELLELHKMTVTKIAWDKSIKRGRGKHSYPEKLVIRDKKILAIAQGNLNLTHKEIGRLFNLSSTTIHRILHTRQGFSRLSALKAGRDQKILSVLRSKPKLSYRKVGKMFGLSHAGIRYIALQAGIVRKKIHKK